MKRPITKLEQQRINELLDKRRNREIDKVLSVSQSKERLSLYDENNYVCKNGLTHLENEHLNDMSTKTYRPPSQYQINMGKKLKS